MTEPPLNEAERCLLVIMEKLNCEEMAEFSRVAIAAAANQFAIGVTFRRSLTRADCAVAWATGQESPQR